MNLTTLAVGDSVVWGQGLAHGDKFASLAHQRLTGETLPEAAVNARSGAIIGPGDSCERGEDPANHSDDRTAVHEVPYELPLIPEQLAAAADSTDPDDVELLFLDGGANDVELFRIVNPRTDRSDIDEWTHAACYDAFTDVLESARRTFPNAVVVVTGYYPAITDTTSLGKLAGLALGRLGALFAPLAVTPSAGFILGYAGAVRVAQNARYFHRRQLHWLRKAVAEVNQNSDLNGPTALFAHAGFGPENGLLADDPWVTGPGEHDAQADTRRPLCRQLYGRLEAPRYFCEHAAVCHPNEAGAREYADEIVRRYREGTSRSLREDLTGIRGQGVHSASCREQFTRYGLPHDGFVRANLDHLEVDVLQVTVATGGNGTNSDVYLRVNDDLQWELDRELLEEDYDDFGQYSSGTYTIDPVYEGRDRPLELGDIEELSLVKCGAAKWQPTRISVELNGVRVFDTAIREMLSGNDKWVGHYPHALVIDTVQADAPGVPEDDHLDEEYVVVRNASTDSQWLDGYHLDYGDGRGYRFPRMRIEGGMRVTVRTGVGDDEGTDLHAGYRHAVLNNESDAVKLRHDRAGVVDQVAW